MNPGELRHRIALERPVVTQDEHGAEVITWTQEWPSVPAKIAPISGKEFLAGQGIVGQVTERITIRWRPDVDPAMRAVRVTAEGSPARFEVYNIAAVLPDDKSGREWITLMCNRGVNNG